MGVDIAVTDKTIFGDRRVRYGTFNFSGANFGGPISTGFDRAVDFIWFTPYKTGGLAGALGLSGAMAVLSGGSANTLPISGGIVEVLTSLSTSGAWMAIGR